MLHADWTELTGCVDTYMDGQEGGHVDQRRYFYVTLFARDLLLKRFKELKEEEGLALEEVTGAETGGP